jgi:hypothetical protein
LFPPLSPIIKVFRGVAMNVIAFFPMFGGYLCF